MILLTSTSDLLRVVTASASQIEVHASYVDLNGTTVTPGRTNTPHITTATTTTVVASPAASTSRNVKYLNVTNDHASQSCVVAVEHTDGTTAIELISVTLLAGENLVLGEEGYWSHRDANGAEYPPAGKGAYNGYAVQFMKSGSAADTVGYWYCTSKDAGFPGAWSPGTPGVNGRNTDGTSAADYGCIPIKNPATGTNFITDIQMAATVIHTHMLFDVLWVNTGLTITTTTAQTITMASALPARDINGSTNGEGCIIGVLCTGAVGLAATSATATVSYTNSDGTSGKTATLTAIAGAQAPATPVVGTIVWFSLAAGDRGVQSIQSITLNTSWVSGTISLLIARPIATLATPVANVAGIKNCGTPGIKLPNNVCLLHCVLVSAVTATFFSGELVIQEK